MRPIAILSGLAMLAVAGCEQTSMQSQDAALEQFSDPSPYATPVEEGAEPTDGAMNEINDD